MFRCYSYTIIRECINSSLQKLLLLKQSIEIHRCVVNMVVVWLRILGTYWCLYVALFGSRLYWCLYVAVFGSRLQQLVNKDARNECGKKKEKNSCLFHACYGYQPNRLVMSIQLLKKTEREREIIDDGTRANNEIISHIHVRILCIYTHTHIHTTTLTFC